MHSSLTTNQEPSHANAHDAKLVPLFLTQLWSQDPIDLLKSLTINFTCIATNVIYCITCSQRKKIYIGETGRTPTRRRTKQHRSMWPNQSRPISISLIIPTTAWLLILLLYPYTTGTQKAAKISNKNLFFNWVHSLHMELMNASHSTNLFTNSCDHISTNG